MYRDVLNGNELLKSDMRPVFGSVFFMDLRGMVFRILEVADRLMGSRRLVCRNRFGMGLR